MFAIHSPPIRLPFNGGFALKFLAFVVSYVLLARLAQLWMSTDGMIGTFWPASGLALGVVLSGGKRYLPGVFLAQLIVNLLAGLDALAGMVMAAGNLLEATAGVWLLHRLGRFDLNLPSLRDYLRLSLWAGLLAPAASASLGIGTLSYLGKIGTDTAIVNLQHWWLANTLGIGLVTPLLLSWHHRDDPLPSWKQATERTLLLALTIASGQVIYFDWLGYSSVAQQFPNDITFLLVIWAAVRADQRTVSVMLCIFALQTMIGTHRGLGYYAERLNPSALNAWFHLMSLSLVGMSTSIFVASRRRSEGELRIAATAFECQEGMIITDAHRRILRTNQSFSRIMGYDNEEVIGKTTEFMRSDRHSPDFYVAAWKTAEKNDMWSDEVWHRRKNGEVFPQWLTCTAVRDESGVIVNYVVTHTDITEQKRQEASRLAAEAEHRNALVREVHHRIKNNLQGITGMLRQFANEHPELTGPLNQAIGQVRSVAVIHGLQGRASLQTVRLCELTSAIAADIGSLWQTPIRIDIPSDWIPGILAETEAVPVALVLNELILNAVKHGGWAHRHVEVSLCKGGRPDIIEVTIRNLGRWRANASRPDGIRSGLQLVEALLPRFGAHLSRGQREEMVEVKLALEPPVITLETEALT